MATQSGGVGGGRRVDADACVHVCGCGCAFGVFCLHDIKKQRHLLDLICLLCTVVRRWAPVSPFVASRRAVCVLAVFAREWFPGVCVRTRGRGVPGSTRALFTCVDIIA